MADLEKKGKKQREKNRAKIAAQQRAMMPKPVVPPPAPISISPEVYDYESTSSRRRSGYRRTIRAGNVSPNSGKKTVLG